MRRLPYLPAAVLCLVVIVQRYQVRANRLTPWMGAGFSMFSTTDDPFARHLRCVAVTADGRESVRVPPLVEDLPAPSVTTALHLPTAANLAPVADALARARCGVPAEEDLAALRVEVWSLRYDRARATVEPFLVASVPREVAP